MSLLSDTYPNWNTDSEGKKPDFVQEWINLLIPSSHPLFLVVQNIPKKEITYGYFQELLNACHSMANTAQLELKKFKSASDEFEKMQTKELTALSLASALMYLYFSYPSYIEEMVELGTGCIEKEALINLLQKYFGQILPE